MGLPQPVFRAMGPFPALITLERQPPAASLLETVSFRFPRDRLARAFPGLFKIIGKFFHRMVMSSEIGAERGF
jgi:hypothetical protein